MWPSVKESLPSQIVLDSTEVFIPSKELSLKKRGRKRGLAGYYKVGEMTASMVGNTVGHAKRSLGEVIRKQNKSDDTHKWRISKIKVLKKKAAGGLVQINAKLLHYRKKA